MKRAELHIVQIGFNSAGCSCGRMPVAMRPASEAIGKFTVRANELHRLHLIDRDPAPSLFAWEPEASVPVMEGGLFA